MNNKHHQNFKSKGFLSGFYNAFSGLWTAMKSERNLRVHIVVAVLVIISSFILSLSYIEWVVVVMCIGLVISAELINSAIEQMADAITQEHNQFIKNAKDIAAGAVLVTSIIAVIVAAIIFIPKLTSL